MSDPANLDRASLPDLATATHAAHFLTMAGSDVSRAVDLLELLGCADPALLSKLNGARSVIAYSRMALDAALKVEHARRLDASPDRALEELELARTGLELGARQ